VKLRGWSNWRPAGHIRPEAACNRPARLFVNLLMITTVSFILFIPKDLKKIVILTSSAALRTRVSHAIDFKTLP
jgi:hypothetical protein